MTSDVRVLDRRSVGEGPVFAERPEWMGFGQPARDGQDPARARGSLPNGDPPDWMLWGVEEDSQE